MLQTFPFLRTVLAVALRFRGDERFDKLFSMSSLLGVVISVFLIEIAATYPTRSTPIPHPLSHLN
jgi:hypothetical protein